MQANYNIGIMGKKGSGKTELVKKSIVNMDRYIVVDVMGEYEKGVIFYKFENMIQFLNNYKEDNFHIIFRPTNDQETDYLFSAIEKLNRFTLVLEEADNWCNPNKIDQRLLDHVRYGRHFRKNLIWVSRNPFEINRNLTRQSDLLITFVQTEPRDLEYFSKYPFDKDLTTLKEFEYACSGDKELISVFEGEKHLEMPEETPEEKKELENEPDAPVPEEKNTEKEKAENPTEEI